MLGERAVAIVVKQKLLYHVVGHKDIGEAVAVVVGKSYAEAVTFLSRNPGLHTHIFKGAVAPVVIEEVVVGENSPGGQYWRTTMPQARLRLVSQSR